MVSKWLKLAALAACVVAAGAACGGDEGGDEGGGAGGTGGDACAQDPCACATVDCVAHPECDGCGGVPDCAATPEPEDGCTNASDCGNVADFACVNNCCIELCSSAADCAARPECAGAALGCVCDEGFCKTKVCSADDECGGGGQVCVDGGCTAAPAATDVDSCTVEPRFGVLHQGDTLQLFVKAYGGGRPLALPADQITYGATGGATVDAAGLVTGGATDGEVVVTATIGATTCTATFTNFAEAAAADLRVVVTDELTGLPVEGAQVQVEGAPVLSGPTDSDGSATFVAVPAGAKTVSVFHDDYSYVTVVGTTRNDLLIQVRRNIPTDFAGGFKGVFGPEDLFDDNNVHAGVAGTSIPGNLVDLSFEILIGPSIPTIINLGGEQEIDLPSGVTIGLGSQWFKEEYQALGVPGVCSDAAKTRAGACGTRTGWGVAGGVPLSELPIDQLAGGGDINIGSLLATLLPRFQQFKSGVARDIEFDLVAAPNGNPNFDSFTEVDLQATHELALRGDVTIPTLPQIGGQYVAAAIVLGGANAPGRGVVPLGLTAGIDANTDDGETPDGKVNDIEGESTGVITLRMAPNHSGLEGSKYGVIALALNLSGLGGGDAVCTVADRSGCTALAGLVKMFDSFPYDTDVDFGTGFVGFAENATYDAATRSFTGAAATGANVFRVNMKGEGNREWNVFFGEAGSFTLPTPPAGLDDRSMEGGARADLTVQAMKVAVGLDDLVDFDATNFSNLVDVTTAFSTTDVPAE